MGIVNNLYDQASDLFGKVITRKSRVYDASKNKLTICGITIDGITNLELSGDQITKTENGTSQGYYAYYEVWENMTIQFDVLPTAHCIDVLKGLITAQTTNKAWVSMSLVDNGNTIDTYRGHILSYPNLVQNREASDRTFVFGVIPTTSGTSNPMVEMINPTKYAGNAQTFPLDENGNIIRRQLPPPFN